MQASDPRTTAYVRAALRRIVDGLTCPDDGRNTSLYRAAKSMGKLLHLGAVPESDVVGELMQAAHGMGLTSREARTAIRSGIRRGRLKPRQLDDAPMPGRWDPPPPPPMAKAPPMRPRPDRDAVRALWSRCIPVSQDEEATAWLKGRNFPVAVVQALDICRVVPMECDLPAWGHSWNRSGHRLLFPAFDSSGSMASMRARAIRDTDLPKCLPPSGLGDGSAQGLVLACATGVQVLQGAAAPSRVVILEGETDYMRACIGQPRDTALFGMWSGSFTPDIAARIPPGGEAWLATDNDKSGEAYAMSVFAMLSARRTCKRVRVGG